MSFKKVLWRVTSDKDAAALRLCIKYLHKVEADPDYKDSSNPTRGKCYYASVALLHYLGGRTKGYHLNKAEDKDGTHYWVTNADGQILDPTRDQFIIMGRPPPYNIGRWVSVRPNFTKHLPILNAMEAENGS